jgi:hypothetical protein
MSDPFALTDSVGAHPDFIYRGRRRTVAVWIRPSDHLNISSQEIELDREVPEFTVITPGMWRQYE